MAAREMIILPRFAVTWCESSGPYKVFSDLYEKMSGKGEKVLVGRTDVGCPAFLAEGPALVRDRHGSEERLLRARTLVGFG